MLLHRDPPVTDILLGKSDIEVFLKGKFGNRHGLIAGATGTGKSVTLMRMAEGFSGMGVPVFLADVKGDLAGLAQAGVLNDRIKEYEGQYAVSDKLDILTMCAMQFASELVNTQENTSLENSKNAAEIAAIENRISACLKASNVH